MDYDYSTVGTAGMFAGLWGVILIGALWSIVWKGLALWVAARRQEKIWFILLLLINTLGILEIIYLLTTDGFKELKK